MAKDLDTYLKELQAALSSAGADRALVQDALFDAEEHLRDEMSERYESRPDSVEEYQTRFAAVIEGYGTPTEVAAAYLVRAPEDVVLPAGSSVEADEPASKSVLATSTPSEPSVPQEPTESTVESMAAVAPAPAEAEVARTSALRQIFGVVVDPAIYKALLYMVISLATGIAYFTIVITGLATAGGMLVMIIGVPLLLLVLAMVRGMALLEGRLVEVLLGTRMPRRDRAELPEAGWLQRIGFWLKDGRTWASMAYMILLLPLGIVYFTLAVTGLATSIGLIFSPVAIWLNDQAFTWHEADYVFQLPLWASPLLVVGGLVVLVLWMHAIRWIGRGHAVFAKNMLVRLAR